MPGNLQTACCLTMGPSGVPVAAVGERGDHQPWSVPQILVTVSQACVDHLRLQLILL